MGARRRCCCNCVQYTDDFFRADDPTGWGELWDTTEAVAEVVGYTGKLTEGYAIYKLSLPDPEGSGIVAVELYDPQDGDIYDVYLAWRSTTNYLVARFQADAASGYWINSLQKHGSGSWWADNVEMMAGCGTYQEPFMSSRTFIVSYDRGVLRIGGNTPEFPHYEHWLCCDVSYGLPNKIGLAHGGGPRPIYFDNFFASDHYVHNVTCPYYGCVCGVEA